MTNEELMEEVLRIADTIENNGGWHIAAVKLRGFVGEHKALIAEYATVVARWKIYEEGSESIVAGLEAELAAYRTMPSSLPDRIAQLEERLEAAHRAMALLQTECQRWQENCTGRHGSQMPCVTAETPAKHLPNCSYHMGYGICNCEAIRQTETEGK